MLGNQFSLMSGKVPLIPLDQNHDCLFQRNVVLEFFYGPNLIELLV